MAFPAQCHHVQHVAADGIQVGGAGGIQEAGIKIHAHVSAGGEQRAELAIRQVPGMRAQGVAAGMGGCGRQAQLQQIVKPPAAQVAGVRRDAQPPHLQDGALPEGGEGRVLIQDGGDAQAVFIVPADGRHPHAAAAPGGQQGQIALHQIAPFHRQEEGAFPVPGVPVIAELPPAAFFQRVRLRQHPVKRAADAFSVRAAADVQREGLHGYAAGLGPFPRHIAGTAGMHCQGIEGVRMGVAQDHGMPPGHKITH